MSYSDGKRLLGQRASKLGHLDVVSSPLVNQLVEQFEDPEPCAVTSPVKWQSFDVAGHPLRVIFAVDGAKQTVRSDVFPYKELSFIKAALLRLDQQALARLDPMAPHPMALRDIMAESAMFHATVLPLKGVRIRDMNNYDAVRSIVFDSLHDSSLDGEMYRTLKWLAYEKWLPQKMATSPSFACPHCQSNVDGLSYDSDEGVCDHCGGALYLTDMIGFHLDMSEESAPDSVSTAYMLVCETLLLFTGIRFFWENEKYEVLKESLFLKDGPLSLHSQYSKLVIPIRNFLEYAHKNGVTINIVGQEKTGAFVDHLDLLERSGEEMSLFAPSNDYIRKEIQQQPERSEPYGSRTNYGNKIFVKIDEYHSLVLSVATGQYVDTDGLDKFLGIERIWATLPKILSHRHERALMPIVLVDGVASLSSYPSAAILKVFSGL